MDELGVFACVEVWHCVVDSDILLFQAMLIWSAGEFRRNVDRRNGILNSFEDYSPLWSSTSVELERGKIEENGVFHELCAPHIDIDHGCDSITIEASIVGVGE